MPDRTGPKALQDAKPTSVLIGIGEFALFYKNRLFSINCAAEAHDLPHRTSENILPLNLLSDDKIRRTAVSVYTDLIYVIL